MTKKTLLLAIPATLAVTASAQATLIAGWDTFVDDPFIDPLPANITDGVSASFTVIGDQVVSFGDARGASIDGTFGALASPAANPVPTAGGGASIDVVNGSVGIFTFSLANTSGADITLDEFVFDALARRANGSRTYELRVEAGGGLSSGIIFTSEEQAITIGAPGGPDPADQLAHDEIGISFSSLADATLGVGESATLILEFTGGTFGSGGNDVYVDNIGITSGVALVPGDADGDGDVDDTDLGIAISNFTGPGGTGKTLAEGDTDGDGDVDDTDLGVAISGFTGPLAAAVPEPTSLALLGLGGLLVARRRRA